jgi:hypothetical protein
MVFWTPMKVILVTLQVVDVYASPGDLLDLQQCRCPELS